MTVLYDNIGELVTNDPAQGDGSVLGHPHRDAAMVVDGRSHRLDRADRHGAPGCGAAGRLRKPQRDTGIRRQPCSPRLRRGQIRRVRRADERRTPTTAAASRPRLSATRAADGPRAGGQPRPTVRRALAKRRHHFRDQERIRPDRHRRTPGAGHRRSRHSGDNVSRCARRSRRVLATVATNTSAWSRGTCWWPARPRPGGSTCSAIAARSTSTRRGRSCKAGADAGLGLRMHASQLAAGPGIKLAVELGAASVDHCTYADDGDLEALAASTTVATLLPGAEFSTRAPWPDGRRFVEAGRVDRPCDRLQSRHVVHDQHAVLHRPGGPRYASDARRGVEGGHQGRSVPPCAATTSECSRPASGRTSSGSNAPSYIHLAYRPGVPIVDDVVQSGAPTQRKQIEQ